MVLELMRFTEMVGVSLSVQSRSLNLNCTRTFTALQCCSTANIAVQTVRGAELLCRSLAMRRVPSLGGRHL